MISVVLATGLGIALPKVVELPIESAEIVAVVAVAQIRFKEDDHLAVIQNLCDSVRNGTKDFTRKELVEYGQQAGVPIEASVLGDFITVQVAAPKGKLSIALAVMASILCDPMIDQDHWEDFCATTGLENAADWEIGLWPKRQWSKLPSLEFVKWVHGSAFNQERITLGIGGSYDRASVLDEVRSAFTNYESKRVAPRPPRHPGKAEISAPGKVQIHQLEGPIGRPGDAATWVALHALAGGKTSAAYEELREKQGSTYRLEGFIEWRDKGPTFRLAVAALPEADGLSRDKLIDPLKARVEAWTDDDIRTGIAGLQATASSWMPRTLFRVRPNAGYDGSVTDQTRWAALAAAAGTNLPEPSKLAEGVGAVEPATVKSLALEWLQKATYSVSGPKSG